MKINKRLLSKISLVAGALLITVYVNSKNNLDVEVLRNKIVNTAKTKEDKRQVDSLEFVDRAEVKNVLDEDVNMSKQFVDEAEVKIVEDKAPSEEPLKTKEPVINEITKGLSYIITKEGDASVIATAGKKVSVHYTGYLQNADGSKGKKFDSSKDRGELFQFPLGAGYVIRGWDMGVEGMLLGEERTLIIAPEFGYGSRGAGGVIPGNATLIFDVEFHGQK